VFTVSDVGSQVIDTLEGVIEATSLGTVLMHEHLFVLTAELPRPLQWFEPSTAINEAVAELARLKRAGVDTVVDLTVPGLGRRIDLMRAVSAQTEIQIVAATGWYTYGDLPPYFQLRRPRRDDPEQDLLTELFVRELTEGIDQTPLRAGVIKCVTDRPGVTPDIRRILRAAAAAHRQTGATIMTHADAETKRGLEQVAIFREEGVDLRRVVIGHCGDSTDMGYLEALLADGVTLGMDRFGLSHLLDTPSRLATVASLVAQGASDQLILSHDAAISIDWVDPPVRERRFGDWRFTYLPSEGIPALLALGVSERDLDRIFRATPRRLLARRFAPNHAAGDPKVEE
jgi:phosphotriesterase-related protein